MKLYLFEDKNIAEERIDIHYRAMTIHLNRIIGAIKEGEPSVTGWDENNESKVFNYFSDVYYFETVDRKSYAYLKEKTYKVDMTLGKVLYDYGDFGGFLNVVSGSNPDYYVNSVMMLLWSGIAVVCLYTYSFFDRWHPAVVITLQYIVAQTVVMGTIWIAGFFGEQSKNAYRDAFRSFTLFYVIGAVIYYVETFRSAKRANKLLNEIL